MRPSRATLAWAAGLAVAGPLALAALARWLWAMTLDGPVLYGEGAVAHAALLARERLEYVAGARYGDVAPIFTAANYPPLYFHLAGLGDPFVTGRAISGISTILVAVMIAWRARAGGPLASVTLGLAWLATFPVVVWGVAVKPDLVALVLTVAAALALESRLSLVAGLLIALAAFAKPTELLPAFALAVALALVRDARALGLYAIGAAIGILASTILTVAPDKNMYLHVVDWNALAFHFDQSLLLTLVAVIAIGIPLLAVLFVRRAIPVPIVAYAVAGLAIMLLGGREGATINYLLDLAAAAFLALAVSAARLRASAVFAPAVAAQLLVTVLLFDPFGASRAGATGAWSDPARIAAARAIEGQVLAEDSALLVASGREPLVDDLFLWSRVYERGRPFAEGDRLLEAVGARRLDAVVSEVDLARLETAPAYERQRWADALVKRILDGYRLDRRDGALFIYVRR